LFLDPLYATHWVENWRQTYLMLTKEYNTKIINKLDKIDVDYNLNRPNFYSYNLIYHFLTNNNDRFEVYVNISEDAFNLINPDFVYDDNYKQITEKIFLNYNHKSKKDIEKINKYVVIFYKKIEEYFAKNNNVVFGDTVTKLIRAKLINLVYKNVI